MGEDVCDRGDISLINERISMTTSFNCPGDRQAGFLKKPGSTAQSGVDQNTSHHPALLRTRVREKHC